jgi:hypothetical protein
VGENYFFNPLSSHKYIRMRSIRCVFQLSTFQPIEQFSLSLARTLYIIGDHPKPVKFYFLRGGYLANVTGYGLPAMHVHCVGWRHLACPLSCCITMLVHLQRLLINCSHIKHWTSISLALTGRQIHQLLHHGMKLCITATRSSKFS